MASPEPRKSNPEGNHKLETDGQCQDAGPFDGLEVIEEENLDSEQKETVTRCGQFRYPSRLLPAEKEGADLYLDLKDCIGRKYRFPWRDCQTWKQMTALLNDVFYHVEADLLRKHINEEHYDMVSEEGFIVHPRHWEDVVKPGTKLFMKMWPMPSSPPKKPAPPALFDILGGPPPAPPGALPCPIVVNPSKKKKKGGKTWCPPPAPNMIFIEPEFNERIHVISRSRFEAEDRVIVDKWLAKLPTGTERTLELDLPYEDEKDLRDQYIFKWKVILALLNLPPTQSLFYLMYIVDQGAYLGQLSQLQSLDALVVVLDAIRSHCETRRAIGEKEDEVQPVLTEDHILAQMYGRGILDLTSKEDSASRTQHRNLVGAAHLAFNIWNTHSLRRLTHPKRRRSVISISSYMRDEYKVFKLDELNLHNLQNRNVKIEWTSDLTDHLLLKENNDYDTYDTRSSQEQGATLYIYWHDFEKQAWLASYFMQTSEDKVLDHCRELRATWSILFQPDGLFSRRKAERAYKDLNVPYFITAYAPIKPLSNIGTLLASPTHAKYCAEPRAHLAKSFFDRNFFRARRFNADDFPVYADRLEILKKHLDAQDRPGIFGWRALKQNEKDAPWVFWLVIGAVVFGVFSLLFAVLTLTSGIVQAWASVKTMKHLDGME